MQWAGIVLGCGLSLWLKARKARCANGCAGFRRAVFDGVAEDEPGRFDDEGPQHWVTISKGFWMFDNPVTQALWQAVMKENPSEFKTPDRPVEQVSWNDCWNF